MTACIIHSADIAVERASVSAATAAGFDAGIADAPADFGSRLYREPDAIGILWAPDGFSGTRTVREFRRSGIKNRMIVLLDETGDRARDAVHRARTLIAGADDCQPDSMATIEMMARLKAIAGRGVYIDHLAIKLPGGCVYYDARKTIETPRGPIRLRPKCGDVLRELARKPGWTLSTPDLMDALYPDGAGPEPGMIAITVFHLRAKIMEATGGLDCVSTLHGRGYCWIEAGFEVRKNPSRTRRREV